MKITVARLRRTVVLMGLLAETVLAEAGWLRGEFTPINNPRSFKPKAALLVPRVESRPAIDGKTDETVWAQAAKIPALVGGDPLMLGQTEVFLAADTQNLYVAFLCHEPDMQRVRTLVTPPNQREAAVWADDSTELFVDARGDATIHYQFIINPAGAVYYAENGGRGTKWEADFQSAAHRGKGLWSAEYALPFRILGLDGNQTNIALRMQFCRTATPRGEMTSWCPSWGDAKQFGPVVVDRRGGTPTFEEISLGNFCLGKNVLRVSTKDFPEGECEAQLSLEGKPLPAPLAFRGGSQTVTQQYDLAAENTTVKAELTIVRKGSPPRVLETAQGTFYVPPPFAACFRNAHVEQNGTSRMWVRVLTGGAEQVKARATVVNSERKAVRSLALPEALGGAGEGWFDFDASGLAPGKYEMRIESEQIRSSAAATFWVERLALPERASIPIAVDEPVGRNWQSFPVSVGVPFPHATLDSAERVRLVDSRGREMPAQVKVSSTWGKDGRDVRWLLVDFLADAVQNVGGSYRLEYGRAVKRATVANPLKVVETKDTVSIDTGKLRIIVDRRAGSILKEAALNGRRVLTGEGAGLYLQNQDRKVFCSAWDTEAPEVVVEERGPIRATLRESGWYAANDGERLCRYDIRIHAFAGQNYLKILHTWILTHDSRKVRFGDLSMRFPLAEVVSKIAFGVDDQYQSNPFESGFRDTTRVNLVHEDSDRFTVNAWRGEASTVLKSGAHAGGWAAAWTGNTSVLAHLRDLWQQYPAELEVSRNALSVHFWPEHNFSFEFHERPDRYGVHRWPYTDGPFMDLQPHEYVEKVLMKDVEKIHSYDQINALGMAKTQEVWLDFGAPTRSATEHQEQARKFEEPLAARPDSQWIANTRVFRPFLPRDEKAFPLVERAARARWDANTYLQDRCHDYGWLHYGDRHSQSYPFGPTGKFDSVHRYWLVSDYRCGMEPWLLWARSGERQYFRWAEILSRHVMDVDIIHWTGMEVGPPRRAGQFYPMSFAHYCSAPTSMSLHNDPIGFNMMVYYLTGYRRALDVLLASGERELDSDLSRSEMHRGHAITGHNQLDMYRMTWDDRYWDNAFKAINKGLDAMVAKTYLDPVYVWEWLHDVEEFTGDSRLKSAVLNIADNIIGKPLGTMDSYPALYVFGHAYELTGDPKYIAWGKGKLQMHVSNVNVSDEPERRGRVTPGDNVHFTRLFRQVPGFLYYQKLAEAKHGVIPARTQPILFIYERGPVYFREEKDGEFRLWLHLNFLATPKAGGDIAVTAPNGKLVLKREVSLSELKRPDSDSSTNRFDLTVPADGQTGTYRLDLNIPTEGGDVQGTWGIESPDLRKIAYGLTKFDFWGGHVFFFVPKGTMSFKIRVEPRRFAALYGQPVVLAPDGREVLRLDGMKPDWVEIKPKPEDTGGLWGIILFDVGVFEMEGLPPFVYADRGQFFVPEGASVLSDKGT